MQPSRLALLLFLAAFGAHAQQYPAKPVRVLIGYAAGSSTDIVGRVMESCGESLFVFAQPGFHEHQRRQRTRKSCCLLNRHEYAVWEDC